MHRLLERWRDLREAGQLAGLLPGCTSRSWETDGVRFGFETFDYRVYRPLWLPGAAADAIDAEADLVELYWSVRTRGDRQDPQWAAALNAHVVQVPTESLGAAELDRLYRLVVSLRVSLQHGGIGPLMAEGVPIALHVRGLLLAPASIEPVGVLEALAGHADVPLTIGRFEDLPDGHFRFTASNQGGRGWDLGVSETDRLRRLGETLLSQDRLFRDKGSLVAGAPDSVARWADDRFDHL